MSNNMDVSTKLQKSVSTGSLGIVTRSSRPYTLDKPKALENKMKSCTKEHITFCMKAGKNFVIEFSTAAYELSKTQLLRIFNSKNFKEKYGVAEQVGIEETGATVDICYKIYNRKVDGTAGNQLKFVVNLYNTQSKINVNGNRVDLFINHTFDELCKSVQKNFSNLDILNTTIATQIASLQSCTSEYVKNSVKEKENHAESNKINYGNNQPAPNKKLCLQLTENNGKIQNSGESEPLVQETTQESCPFCCIHVEDGIACDSCNFWYHFECIGLKGEKEKEKISEEYFCPSCSEDMLYCNIDAQDETQSCDAIQIRTLVQELTKSSTKNYCSEEFIFETRNELELNYEELAVQNQETTVKMIHDSYIDADIDFFGVPDSKFLPVSA